jgi:hypothetical protein
VTAAARSNEGWSKGNDMKTHLLALALAACLASPIAGAQIFSWDPLKDVENALPAGTPNESRIIRGRIQVREMAQDALSTLHEVAPGTRRVIDRASGYAVFSTFGVKLFFAGGTTGKGVGPPPTPVSRVRGCTPSEHF